MLSAIIFAPSLSVFGISTANSSPPHRAAKSLERRIDAFIASATIFKTSSPY
jgi:hypothetical protein